jgi:hypothetical protein
MISSENSLKRQATVCQSLLSFSLHIHPFVYSFCVLLCALLCTLLCTCTCVRVYAIVCVIVCGSNADVLHGTCTEVRQPRCVVFDLKCFLFLSPSIIHTLIYLFVSIWDSVAMMYGRMEDLHGIRTTLDTAIDTLETGKIPDQTQAEKERQ